MRVSCVLKAEELSGEATRVIVFPEGVTIFEIKKAGTLHPDAVIVGAVVEHGFCRGIMQCAGEDLVSYLKVECDGRTNGSGHLAQMPVTIFEDLCIGMLICMDLDSNQFSSAVLDEIRRSSATHKILCVPADMAEFWLNGQSISQGGKFAGLHVALCNNTATHNSRCKSFITNLDGEKMVRQIDMEPVHYYLT
jgi:hypothetical protein